MESETEKFHRRKNRDLRAARWIVLLPVVLLLGTCVGLGLTG